MLFLFFVKEIHIKKTIKKIFYCSKYKNGANLSLIMNDKFESYKAIGRSLGMTEKQCNYLAAAGCDFPRKKLMEVAEITKSTIGGTKELVGRKLKFDGSTSELHQYIKTLLDVMSNSTALDAANAVYNGDGNDRLEVLTEYLENKRIADMVRARPENVVVLEAIERDPQVLEEIANFIRARNHIVNGDNVERY